MKLIKFILPVIVIILSIFIARETISNKPVATRKQPVKHPASVEIMPVSKQNYLIKLSTQGTVRAHTETTLVTQVAGIITEISPKLESGQFFEHGDWLLSIDSRDYETAVTVAKSSLTQAKVQLAQEQAQARQAQREWDRLNPGEKPTDLVLRIPQLTNSKATVAAAQAQLDQAKLNLERTHIKAPFAGQIREKMVSLGQYITPATQLLSLFATDYVEVRLPLRSDQMALLGLLKNNREKQAAVSAAVSSEIGGQQYVWPATITRSEGVIDPASRQTYVIARINNPYEGGTGHNIPLKVGQFVIAKIKGKQLEDVFVLPNSVIQPDDSIYTVGSDHMLQRQNITIMWQDDEYSIIAKGLSASDLVVTSPVSISLVGSKVLPVVKTRTEGNLEDTPKNSHEDSPEYTQDSPS